jgi:tRNA A37 threonylcarbamoyladenosine dehydratase
VSGYEARFGGLCRLVGVGGGERLRRAHVCVIGLGGVGSWAVEALARSGVGQLTLVDFDEVCISNSNRQLHALTGDFGKPKVEVMARRVQAVNPECAVHPVLAFFTAKTAGQILATRYDCLVDAIDDSAMKYLLIVALAAHAFGGLLSLRAASHGSSARPCPVWPGSPCPASPNSM